MKQPVTIYMYVSNARVKTNNVYSVTNIEQIDSSLRTDPLRCVCFNRCLA